jgi:hypothetical protein
LISFEELYFISGFEALKQYNNYFIHNNVDFILNSSKLSKQDKLKMTATISKIKDKKDGKKLSFGTIIKNNTIKSEHSKIISSIFASKRSNF